MCDFLFPSPTPQHRELTAEEDDREFYIRFDQSTKSFFVKDMGRGYGVFQEIGEPVPLRDNTLINMGEAYIVANVANDTARAESGAVPPTLKLRVFSAPQSESPDKYQCAHID